MVVILALFCSYNLTELSGKISFHSYNHRPYPQTYRCQYDISLNVNMYQVELQFNSLRLAGSYDTIYIMVLPQGDTNSDYTTRYILYHTSNPRSYLFELQTKVRIIFQSVYVISDTGFEISYNAKSKFY